MIDFEVMGNNGDFIFYRVRTNGYPVAKLSIYEPDKEGFNNVLTFDKTQHYTPELLHNIALGISLEFGLIEFKIGG